MTLCIATHLSDALLAPFAAAAPQAHFVQVAAGSVDVGLEVDALLAMPFGTAGSAMPPAPPTGWPFNLRWIQLLTVGLDYYPDWLLNGPNVTANQGLSGVALAEFAMAAMLNAEKQMPDLWIGEAQHWQARMIGDLAGKTLGLFGFGAFGAALAERAQAFGMKVIAMRRSAMPMPPGVERAEDMLTLVRRSDHLVLAAPSSTQTHHVVNAAILREAKAGLHLVNLSRGSLVDEAALLAALNEGRLARATLDVLEKEPPAVDHPLLAHPRVFVSPHCSTMTPRTIAALVDLFADNVGRLIAGKPLRSMISGEGNASPC